MTRDTASRALTLGGDTWRAVTDVTALCLDVATLKARQGDREAASMAVLLALGCEAGPLDVDSLGRSDELARAVARAA